MSVTPNGDAGVSRSTQFSRIVRLQVENDVGQVMVVTRDERSVLGFNFLHVIDCIGDDDAIPCSVGIHR